MVGKNGCKIEKEEFLKLGDVKIKKQDFHSSKSVIPKDNVNADSAVFLKDSLAWKSVLIILSATKSWRCYTVMRLTTKNKWKSRNFW